MFRASSKSRASSMFQAPASASRNRRAACRGRCSTRSPSPQGASKALGASTITPEPLYDIGLKMKLKFPNFPLGRGRRPARNRRHKHLQGGVTVAEKGFGRQEWVL